MPPARPWKPPPRRRHRAFRAVEVAAAAGVALVVDLTMWAHGSPALGGLGLALVFALVPALLFATRRAERARVPRSIRLGVLVGLLACAVVRCAVDPRPGVVLAGVGLVMAFALALRRPNARVPEVALAIGAATLSLPSRVKAAGAGIQRIARRTRLGQVSVLPIVIPAGLVALFVGVFALANPVVAGGLDAVWTTLAGVFAFPTADRVFLWAVALAFALSLLRPVCKRVAQTETATPSGDATTTALSVARNALVGLNVVFLAYNAIDATYLWTGSPPAGMRTQQYAHEGAFWLTVALLMLTAVIGVMFRGPLAHDPRAKQSRLLAHVWMAQGLVLALGTYRRIAIHIAKSGLSDLRIVGVLGTTLVVTGVILVAVKMRGGKTLGWLLRRQLDALALTAIVYAIAPTHLLSATVNVARVSGGEYRPLLHAFRQSHETESAAALLPLLDHPDPRIRQGVAALLDDERTTLRGALDRRRSWRERDLATTRALATLDAASGRLRTALGNADPAEARSTLLRISKVANEDRSLEEILSIPAASDVWQSGQRSAK